MGRLSGPERRELQASQRAERGATKTQLKGLSIGPGGFNINNKPVTTADQGGAKPTPKTPKLQDTPPKAEATETEPQKSGPASSFKDAMGMGDLLGGSKPNNKPAKQDTSLRYPYKALNPDTDYLKIEILEYVPLGLPQQNNTITALTSSKNQYKDKNKKIISTILLPIPQNITSLNNTGWGSDSLNSLAAYAVGAAGDIMQSDNFFKGIVDSVMKAGSAVKDLAVSGEGQQVTNSFFSSQAANLMGANTSFSGLLARSTGQILNPNTELLFNGVKLRSLNFSFDLAPRNTDEAKQILSIVSALKINMSPTTSTDKISSGGVSATGLFLKSPNVFQLTYMSGGNKHPFLNSFIIAALTNVNVNYTGSGTYMRYNDPNKTPVHMKMDLTFQELSPVYAEDYKGVGGVGY